MFTKITRETEGYYEEHHRRRSTMHDNSHKPSIHTGYSDESAASTKRGQRDSVHGGKHNMGIKRRQKLLIAPAHYVYRFLEGIFQLFCVITYGVLYEDISERLFEGHAAWKLLIAAVTTITTPILYCMVRSFADESQTLERNLIAMVYHAHDLDQIKEIIKLVKAGASLKQTDFEGNNILHACIYQNNELLLAEIIRKYKKHKKKSNVINMNHANDKGFTPAMLAAKVGSVECLDMLEQVRDEDGKAVVNFNEAQEVKGVKGQCLIHIAAQHDEDEVIKYLISLGKDRCDIHAKYIHWSVTKRGEIPVNGNNALHVAAAHNAINAFEILLQHGVDWRAKLSTRDTCAHIAATRGHLVILDMLHNAGDKFTERGDNGHNPLYRAAVNDHAGTVEILGREFGASWHVPDEKGVPIEVKCFQLRLFDVLSSLAHLGVRFDRCSQVLNVEITEKGPYYHLTALMWSCKLNKPMLTKTLLECGANVNYLNRFNETAAHHAAAMGSLDCLRLLRQFAANLTITNSAGHTPYDKAVQQKQDDVVQWFTENNIAK